ncbi:hypothetical protein [Thermodesulfatator autotrophicus]|uniref:Cyclic nucleotide-binding domain-containing protein n=1 Tax=Thermodesulfatator autotrophicus TaxID=1795632 RepID=A0A177E9X6_9BACT|nr:hypothetical protein [Thermodesulfatator autotrophicus]OAG27809.1 hypothetical protein TH606_05055 [Thermodesulfatator autotrophicus]
MKKFFILLIGILAFARFSLAAPPIDQLFKDFPPLSGKIIVQQGQFYLNLGANQGLKIGEWWLVYQPGKPIIDPDTGKVLGYQEKPVARAQVVQVFPAYAVLKVFCFSPGCAVSTGARAERLAGVPAFFFDLTGKAFPVYERLRATYPKLNWQPYQQITSREMIPAGKERVLFVAENGLLYFYSNDHILGVYSLSEQRVFQRPGFGPQARPYKLVGRLREIVYHLDVAPMGQALFLASLTKKKIYFQRLKGREHFVYEYKGFGDLVNFSIGPNGLIAINIFDGKRVKSRLIKFTGASFLKVTKDSPYILRFFDFNLDGVKETLIGQSFDDEEFYGPGVYVFTIEGESLKRKNRLDVPSGFRIFGAFWADLNLDRQLETGFFNVGRKLVIYQGKKKVWSSNIKFGAGVQYVFMDNPEPEIKTPKKVLIWPNPWVTLWQGWPRVFIPYNEYGLLGGILSGAKRSTVAVLFYTREGYQFFLWKESFQGTTQAVFSYKDSVYIAVVEGDFFKGEGETKIFKVPLPQLMRDLSY